MEQAALGAVGKSVAMPGGCDTNQHHHLPATECMSGCGGPELCLLTPTKGAPDAHRGFRWLPHQPLSGWLMLNCFKPFDFTHCLSNCPVLLIRHRGADPAMQAQRGRYLLTGIHRNHQGWDSFTSTSQTSWSFLPRGHNGVTAQVLGRKCTVVS